LRTAPDLIDDRSRLVVEDLLAGYSTMVERRVEAGWRAYLVTMMFVSLPGRQSAVLEQMRDEAERFYRRFVTRVVRRPRSAGSVESLPLLLVAPDLSVGKSDKPLRDVVVNGGLHLHGLLVVPPFSRLRLPADEHVRSAQSLYLSGGEDGTPARLKALDLKPVEGGVGCVVPYWLKSLARRRFGPDDLLVLPRALSELPR
jgi:hypothetical protein